jgi:transcription elongation factor GreA
MKKIQVTQEGFENLQKELKELVEVKRPAVLDRLAKARAMGDLRENSEYSASKEDQGFIEGRIMELEQLLKNIEIVKASGDAGTIQIGTAVVVDTPNGKDTFYIVGEFEADPMNKRLSQTSPIGKALIGKKVGDTVDVEVPAGKLTYKIIEVNHT